MGWGAGKSITVAFTRQPKEVFDALAQISQSLDGFEPGAADPNTWTVTYIKGISLTSWGEKAWAQVTQGPDGRTWVTVTSKLNFGLVDYGKNTKNVNAIVEAASARLGQADVVKPLAGI